MNAARERGLERRRAEVLPEEPSQMPASDSQALRPRLDPRSSRAPSPMSRSARDTTPEVPFQAGVPGAASGRQRRPGRNPTASAAIAVGKYRTFSSFDARAGQIGRQ